MLKKIDPFLVGILLLASVLRLFFSGVFITWIDELNMLEMTLQLAQNGKWVWLGNPSSSVLISGHSPFSVYVTAIPAMLNPHPMFLRLFYGIIGLISIGLMYDMMRQIFGRPAALLSSLLMAVMALPIYWSSFVWNPNLSPPFLIIWMLTAILGYGKGKARAQIIHWLCLDLAVQAQTALLVLLPVSAVLVLYQLWQQRSKWRPYILRHLLIGFLLVLSLIPWIIGLYGAAQGWWGVPSSAGNAVGGDVRIDLPTSAEFTIYYSLLTSSAQHYMRSLSISDNPANWWFPSSFHNLLYLQTFFITSGALLLAGWHLYKRSEKRFVAVFLNVSLFWSFILLIFNRAPTDYYMMLTVFAAIAVFGWLSQILYRYSRWLLIVPLVMVIMQLWLITSVMNWYQRDSRILSYSEIINYVDDWHDGNRDILMWETDSSMNPLEQREWLLHWRILSESYPIRYTSYPLSIPIASEGQVVVGHNISSSWLNDWSEWQAVYENHKRIFELYTIQRENFPPANYLPTEDAVSFAGAALINGMYAADSTDETNGLRHFFIYWQAQQTTERNWQFSLRLIGDDGENYGQIDQLSLQPELWRVGDDVVSFLTMPVRTIPDGISTHYELLMYAYPEGDVLPVFNQALQAIGDTMQFELIETVP